MLMNRLNKASIITRNLALATVAMIVSAVPAQAAGFTAIRIGDVDGFGYGYGTGYKAANGFSVNVDGQGLLGNGDFIPDLNQNGKMATYQGDGFDRRTVLEVGDNYLTGSGFTNKGSRGSQFTDLSLSTSSLDGFFGITPLTVQKQALLTERQTTQTQINELNTRIQSVNSDLAPLWTERKELLTQRQAVQADINQLNIEIENLKSQNQNQSQIDTLKVQTRELLAQRRDINAQINAVNDQTRLFLAQKGSLNIRKQELVTQKKTIQADINALGTQIAQLRSANALDGSKIPQPAFTFDFSVSSGDIVEESLLYLNLLFADYDVKDAEIKFTTANGSFTRQLTKKKNKEGYDGWVESAFVELDFSDVFTPSQDGFDGFLKAEVIAPDEPYLAFDFAELSSSQISIETRSLPSHLKG